MSDCIKETIDDLPIAHFDGEVVVIEDKAAVGNAIDELMLENLLGFDTETKPTFKKGQIHKVALLQICAADKAYLFRLNKTGFAPELISLLENDSVMKVGVGIRDDLRLLNKLKLFKPNGFVDLQDMVKSFGIKTMSLKGLAANILNLRVSKRQRLTNWEASILTPAQIDYAATDAWIALQLFTQLMRTKAAPQPEYVYSNNY
ncbi:MAG: 3'-5' exonuclease domain-containing protein 2 [Cytophagaceae bacterium]|jgi:ribonuclease D|nr:3'-5' exonuclease domain-containing protein 2 [Cytophagaceae bacterium]